MKKITNYRTIFKILHVVIAGVLVAIHGLVFVTQVQVLDLRLILQVGELGVALVLNLIVLGK